MLRKITMELLPPDSYPKQREFHWVLESLRHKRCIKQADLAVLALTSQASLSRLESGDKLPRNVSEVRQLWIALGPKDSRNDQLVQQLMQRFMQQFIYRFMPNADSSDLDQLMRPGCVEVMQRIVQQIDSEELVGLLPELLQRRAASELERSIHAFYRDLLDLNAAFYYSWGRVLGQ
jgi:transcriptional regulator with XRE-family HTH domain